MPIYNAANDLHKSIGSLISQTCQSWKLICIDDGATDESKRIVKQYIDKYPNIKLLCQKNSGSAIARANAIAVVETDYISILIVMMLILMIFRTNNKEGKRNKCRYNCS